MTLREDAQIIMDKALAASLPDAAVEKALKNKKFGSGRIVVVSIGKAAWQMAKTTVALLGDRISGGIVITKYQHAKGALPPLEIYEAGHPVLDANSVAATARAIDMVKDLGKDDTVLFLISGGGSALLKASYSAFGTAENQFRSFIERRRHRFHEYGPQAFQRR